MRRTKLNRREKDITVLTLEAKLNSPEVTELIKRAAELGIMATAKGERQSTPDYISSITARDQFLGREHFFSFGRIYTRNFRDELVGRAFSHATGPAARKACPDIIVVKRTLVGLSPLPPDDCMPRSSKPVGMDLAIEAGSYIDYVASLVESGHRPPNVGPDQLTFHTLLGHRLESLIAKANSRH